MYKALFISKRSNSFFGMISYWQWKMHIKKLYNIGLYKPNDYDYHNIPQNKSVCCISTNFSNISQNYSKTLCIDIWIADAYCNIYTIWYGYVHFHCSFYQSFIKKNMKKKIHVLPLIWGITHFGRNLIKTMLYK